jgi:hypothetical protein
MWHSARLAAIGLTTFLAGLSTSVAAQTSSYTESLIPKVRALATAGAGRVADGPPYCHPMPIGAAGAALKTCRWRHSMRGTPASSTHRAAGSAHRGHKGVPPLWGAMVAGRRLRALLGG